MACAPRADHPAGTVWERRTVTRRSRRARGANLLPVPRLYPSVNERRASFRDKLRGNGQRTHQRHARPAHSEGRLTRADARLGYHAAHSGALRGSVARAAGLALRLAAPPHARRLVVVGLAGHGTRPAGALLRPHADRLVAAREGNRPVDAAVAWRGQRGRGDPQRRRQSARWCDVALSDLGFRLRALLSRDAMRRELHDEMAFHLDMETRQLVDRG
jgi:hypothetical protein